MNIKRNLTSAIWAALVFLAAPYILYFVQFNSDWLSGLLPRLSKDHEKWGQFSDYLNSFISIINSVVVTYITYLFFDYNNKKQEENDKDRRAMERPILAFESRHLDKEDRELRTRTFRLQYNDKSYSPDFNIWSIHEIGNGPAINPIVAFKRIKNGELTWATQVVRANSLGKDGRQDLNWIDKPDQLCAVYKDLSGTSYVSYYAYDQLETRVYSEKEFTPILFKGASEYNTITVSKSDIDTIFNTHPENISEALFPFRYVRNLD